MATYFNFELDSRPDKAKINKLKEEKLTGNDVDVFEQAIWMLITKSVDN